MMPSLDSANFSISNQPYYVPQLKFMMTNPPSSLPDPAPPPKAKKGMDVAVHYQHSVGLPELLNKFGCVSVDHHLSSWAGGKFGST
jgi:hypothetical protein